MEEGMDLRQYVVVLVKHRKLIILATFVAALAAALFSFITRTPPVYEARAGVAILKSGWDIVLSPEFRTLSEMALDLGERRKALAGLVVNSAIASKVIEELGSYLSPEQQNLSTLLGMVDGEVGGEKGDLIEIVVSSGDPEKAAQIANAWGQAYEEYVNALYSTSPGSVAAVGRQLEDARKEYGEREQALVAFMAENELDELNLLIGEKLGIVESLQNSKIGVITTTFEIEQGGRRELVESYIEAEVAARKAVFNEQLNEKLEALAHYYDNKALLEWLLADAERLLELIRTGGASSSTTNALAILLLKAEAFASSGDLPSSIQLQLGAISGLDQGASAQAADLDALISVLKSGLAELETSIAQLSRELLNNEGYDFLDIESPTDDPLSLAIKDRYPQLFEARDLIALTKTIPSLEETDLLATRSLSMVIEELHDELDALRAKLEQEEAQQRELTRARDLAWNTYSTLADKAVEVEIATGMGGSQVRFAAPAVPPLSPVPPKKTQSIPLAAAVGLMIGVGGAFGVEYLAPVFAASTPTTEPIARGDKRGQDANEEQLGRDDSSR